MLGKILLALASAFILISCAFLYSPRTESSSPSEAPRADWWREAVFYEIFVRSFYDTNDDGIGDFNGVAQKLDYLQDLGVTAIWLMPIHPSPSYHGYDVLNYYNVNPQYGTMGDFKNLLEEAHKRDIRIVIDLVLNHTSDQHPFFRNAVADENSPYHDWYLWSETGSGNYWRYAGTSAQDQYYYGLFCGCMPDLNYENPAVTAQMEKVVEFWLDLGVDGFRVDAAKHLIEDGDKTENTPATHEWYKGFYAAYKAKNPQAYTVGEVFGAGSSVVKSYADGQLDQVFNFEMSSGFVNSANGEANSGVVSAFKFALMDTPNFDYATFLANHDQNRAMSVFYGNVNKAKVASFLMLTSPGTPFIYYGEEIGMQGQKPDEDIRLPMQWTGAENAGFTSATPWRAAREDYVTVNVEAQTKDPNSLLNHYKALIQFRKAHTALLAGNAILVETGNSAIFALLRQSGDETLLILVNLGKDTISDYGLSLEEKALDDGSYNLTPLFGYAQTRPLEIKDGKFSGYLPIMELQPYQMLAFEIKSAQK